MNDDTNYEALAKRYGVALPKPPTSPKGGALKTDVGDGSVASVLDDEFAKLGYKGTQRLSILGDIGRENNWNRNVIFKGHNDPKNNAYNRGIISWQGDRQQKLQSYLKRKGVLGKGDDDELRGMAQFMDEELKNDYPDIYKQLKNAKSTYDASEALRQYIKYVPDAPYNTPDPDFRVKNNAEWAQRAKKLGLGTDFSADFNKLAERYLTPQTDIDTLAQRYGVGSSTAQSQEQPVTLSKGVPPLGQVGQPEEKPLFDPKRLQGTQLPPTNPTQVPLQSGVPQLQTLGGTEDTYTPTVAPMDKPLALPPKITPSAKIVPSKNPLIQQARERNAQRVAPTQPADEEPIRIDAIPARQRTVDAVTPQNEDNVLIGTVNVGQARGREAAKIALKQLAPQYNFDPDAILKANPDLTITPNATGNVDIIASDLKAMGIDPRPILAQREVQQRVENPQVDTNLQVFKPTSDPVLEQARRNVFNDPLSKGTDADIQAEYDRLNIPQEKRDYLEAWGRELANAERASGTGGFTSQFLTTLGSDVSNLVAGVRRFDPVSRVGDALMNYASGGKAPLDPRNLDKLAQDFQILGESSKGDSVLMNTGGQLAGGLPGIVGATALAGGNPILGFGLHSLLTHSGEPTATQVKEVGKNLILGAIFSGAGQLGRSLADATATKFLSKEMQEAVANPEVESAVAQTIKDKGLRIAKLATEGATKGEREAGQKALDRFLEKNGLTVEDLTAPEITRNPLFDAAIRREIFVKTAIETGTRAVVVGTTGTVTGLAEGQSLGEAAKQGATWAAMEILLGVLHKKPSDKLTPEDIERVNGSVVKVPDPENPKTTKDILFIADGDKLKAKDVTGKVPPNAVDVQAFPKNDWNKNIEDIVAKEGKPVEKPIPTKEAIESERKTELHQYYKDTFKLPLDVKDMKKLNVDVEVPHINSKGETIMRKMNGAKYYETLNKKSEILQKLVDCIHG